LKREKQKNGPKNLNIQQLTFSAGVGGMTHGLIKSGIEVVAGIDTELRTAIEERIRNIREWLDDERRTRRRTKTTKFDRR